MCLYFCFSLFCLVVVAGSADNVVVVVDDVVGVDVVDVGTN